MMPNNDKIRVAVLYGGRSAEHEISLRSAASVIQYLDRSRFDVVPIGIDKGGHWILNQLPEVFLESGGTLKLSADNSSRVSLPETLISEKNTNNQHARPSTRELFDVVFPVIHGPLCEDGATQGLLELADIPYVGANVLTSSVAMDKDFTKRITEAGGIATVHYCTLKRAQWQYNKQQNLEKINAQFRYPVFVKPANQGSSVGIHRAENQAELLNFIDDAFLYDEKILIEQGVNAQEIEVAVLENKQYGEPALASIPGEIIAKSSHGFYSYEAKYQDDAGAELIVPANISAHTTQQVQQTAIKIFDLLECDGMARVDFFVDRASGAILFNELNTIPGFTTISMYPKLWQASGLTYPDLLTQLIELALARHERRAQLKRDFLQ